MFLVVSRGVVVISKVFLSLFTDLGSEKKT